MKRARIKEKRFRGKKRIPWQEVEEYLKRYIGQTHIVELYQDVIIIPSDFPDEYTGSEYTKSLRGALAVAKANAVLCLDELIKNAANKRYTENKSEKHSIDAAFGWYRYDTYFSLPVQAENEPARRENYYRGTLVVRINERGNELYDLVNIKKEASKPLEP